MRPDVTCLVGWLSALTLSLTLVACAAAAQPVRKAPFTAIQVAAAFHREGISTDTLTSRRLLRSVFGPHVLALVSDPRDTATGHGYMGSAVSAFVLGSREAASGFENEQIVGKPGSIRLQKRNVVVMVVARRRDLRARVALALGRLR